MKLFCGIKENVSYKGKFMPYTVKYQCNDITTVKISKNGYITCGLAEPGDLEKERTRKKSGFTIKEQYNRSGKARNRQTGDKLIRKKFYFMVAQPSGVSLYTMGSWSSRL